MWFQRFLATSNKTVEFKVALLYGEVMKVVGADVVVFGLHTCSLSLPGKGKSAALPIIELKTPIHKSKNRSSNLLE